MSEHGEESVRPDERIERGDGPAAVATGGPPTGGEATDDPEAIRREIEHTRAELGRTVEELAAKTDVKAQAQEKLAQGREQLLEKQDEARAKLVEVRDEVAGMTPAEVRSAAMSAVASVPGKVRERPPLAAALGAVALVWLRRRRKRRRSSRSSE